MSREENSLDCVYVVDLSRLRIRRLIQKNEARQRQSVQPIVTPAMIEILEWEDAETVAVMEGDACVSLR